MATSDASPVAELQVGDKFVVRPGEKIATDGVVREGNSAIDRSVGHRRECARRRWRGRPGSWRHGEYQRSTVGGSDWRWRGHCVGADRAARRRCSIGQGAGAATRRSCVGNFRSGRDPVVDRNADRVVARHRGWHPFVRGGGGGADHRLSLRARSGHAYGAAGGHRPWSTTRLAHQRPRGTRVDSCGRHDRARQDRHRHHWCDDARRRAACASATAATRCSESLVRLESGSEHPIARRFSGPLPQSSASSRP